MNRSTLDSFDALFLSTGQRLGHFSAKEAGDAAEAAAKLDRSGHPVPIETLATSLGLAADDAVAAIVEAMAAGEYLCAGCGTPIAGRAIVRRRSVACPKCGESGVERASRTVSKTPAVRDRKTAPEESGASKLTGLALAALRRLTFPDEPEAKPEPGDPFMGKAFGRYRIQGLLGIGGWGNVYLAESEERLFALKILRLELGQSTEHLDRFLTEARITASLEHGVIRRTVDIGKHHGQHYMAMEYVDGLSLHALVMKNGPFPPALSVQISSRLADALQFASRHGVVHRDIKPRNVLVARAGEVKLTDFGLARMLLDGSGMTGTGAVMGTPEFMSPEQFDGARVDRRSDIYALGCTLFFMLTGRPPFEGTDFATLMRLHKTATPPSPLRFNRDIPLPLCSALSRMLEKKPSARFQDYGEILEAFTGTSEKAGASAEGLEEQWMDEERVKRCMEVQAVFTAENMAPPPRWHVLAGLGYASGDESDFDDDFFDQPVVLRCGRCARSFRFTPPLKSAFGCPSCGGVDLEHRGFSIGLHACYLFLRTDDARSGLEGAGDDLVRVADMVARGGTHGVVLDFSACAGFPNEIMGPLLRLREVLTSDRVAPALLASPRGLKQIKERGLQEFFLAFASEKDVLAHIDAAGLCPHLRYFLCAVRGQLTEQEEQVAQNLALSTRSCIDRAGFEAFYPQVRDALRKNDARAARAACAALVRRLAKAPCLQAAAKKARDFAEDAIRLSLERAAQAHFARGRIDRARVAARETLAAFPDSPAAAEILAQIALREGRPSEAAGHFEAAARDAKAPAEYRLSEAAALQRAGDAPGALQCLDAILAEDPSHFRAWQFKGTLHFGRGEFEDAREAFSRALELQPASADVLLWRGRTNHRLNLLQDSLRDFVHANRAEPRRPRTLANCGAICARLGRHKEAIAFLKSAIHLNPALSGPRYNLACALAASGESEAALEALRDAVGAGWANRQLADRDVLLKSLREDATLKTEFDAILDSMAADGETEEY
ncbi:MAG: protein kinase [Planctomycetes bacterium]|nr:protein kinase [Planctomycetota bacterium]